MKSQTLHELPEIPVVDPGTHFQLSEQLDEEIARGNFGATISGVRSQRVAELQAEKLPTIALVKIEREQKELSDKQADLEAKRRQEVSAVSIYARLKSDYQSALARLNLAEHQLSKIPTADEQRAYILSHIGDTHSPFEMRMQDLFAQLAVCEAAHREWPAIREKLQDRVDAAFKSAADHAERYGIGKTKPVSADSLN
jgi:hypothetical protein